MQYNNILNKMNRTNQIALPNYIPVKNMKDFNYDVYAYYNQYYASPYVTQQRRILRNYYSNNQTIKESNKNVFINNNSQKINFLYTFSENYMIIEKNNKLHIYLWVDNIWRFAGCTNKDKCIINSIKK